MTLEQSSPHGHNVEKKKVYVMCSSCTIHDMNVIALSFSVTKPYSNISLYIQ